MSGKLVAAKLGIKPGHAVLLIAPPPECEALLGPMPADVSVVTEGQGPFDAVIVFVPTSATLTTHSARAVKTVRKGGLLWLAYPKRTGGIASDMYRERAWEAFASLDWRPVSQVALDDTWS